VRKFDPFVFEREELGGVPVFFKRMSTANEWLGVCVVLRVGARHDPEGKEGLAHFVEHMWSRGTDQLPHPLDIHNASENIFLGSLNAATNFDATVFWGRLPTHDLMLGMEVLRDVVFFPLLRTEDIRHERKVIRQEILEEFDGRAIMLDKLWRDDVYGSLSPFGRMMHAFGTPQSVSSVGVDDVRGFHHVYYVPSNIAAIVFVGDITQKRAIQAGRAFLGGIDTDRKSAITLPCPTPITQWPLPKQNIREISYAEETGYQRRRKTTSIGVRRVMPKSRNSQILPVLTYAIVDAIEDILRRQYGIAYEVVWESNMYADHYLFSLRVRVPSQMSVPVKGVLMGFFEGAGEERMFTRHFSQTKKALTETLAFPDYNIMEMISVASADISNYGMIVPLERNVKERRNIRVSEMKRIIKEELSPDQLHWFVVNP